MQELLAVVLAAVILVGILLLTLLGS